MAALVEAASCISICSAHTGERQKVRRTHQAETNRRRLNWHTLDIYQKIAPGIDIFSIKICIFSHTKNLL